MEVDTTATLFNLYTWLHVHRKRVLAGAVVVIVVVGVVTFKFWRESQNEAEAGQELLGTQTLAGPPTLGVDASMSAFVGIAQDYPGTQAGAAAELLAAKTLFLTGKFSDSEKGFAKFIADHPGNELMPQAKVGLGAALEAEGKISEAVNKYKEIAASYSADQNIVLPVKLTLGRLNEAENKPDVAATYYEDLARINNPYDPWVAEAGERLRLLFAAHPELNPAAAQKSAQPSMLAPSEAEMQMAPPSTNGTTAPKPVETPKSVPNSPFLQMPTNLPPAAK